MRAFVWPLTGEARSCWPCLLMLMLLLRLLLRRRRGGEVCAVLVDGDASIAPEGLHKASSGLGGGARGSDDASLRATS